MPIPYGAGQAVIAERPAPATYDRALQVSVGQDGAVLTASPEAARHQMTTSIIRWE